MIPSHASANSANPHDTQELTARRMRLSAARRSVRFWQGSSRRDIGRDRCLTDWQEEERQALADLNELELRYGIEVTS